MQETTRNRIEAYRERFQKIYPGEGHYIFALHAALPVLFTPDLLYQLWLNFKTYPKSENQLAHIPQMAVPDLLLSTLCREVGHELYDMEKDIRDELLRQFDARFTILAPKRKLKLANFLHQYADQHLRLPRQKNIKSAIQLTALAIINPQEMKKEIVQSLQNTQRQGEIIRQLMLYHTLAPSEEQDNLLQISQGVVNQYQGESLAPVIVSEAEGDRANIVSIPMPEVLRGKIKKVRIEPVLSDGYQEALRRIQEAKEKELRSLDLGNLGITEVPPEVFELTQLTVLKLGEEYNDDDKITETVVNKISIIPKEIGNLINLEKLILNANAISALPPEIGNLNKLEVLALKDNHLTSLPDEFTNLTNLKRLHLNRNELREFPPFLLSLKKLELLSIVENKITHFPTELLNHKHLKALYLVGNDIENLSGELFNWPYFNSLPSIKNYFYKASSSQEMSLRNLVIEHKFQEAFDQLLLLTDEKMEEGSSNLIEAARKLRDQFEQVQNLHKDRKDKDIEIAGITEAFLQIISSVIKMLSSREKDGTYWSALQEIQSALDHQARELDLSNMGLNVLPDSFNELTQVRCLILGRRGDQKPNQIEKFADQLLALPQLEELWLSGLHLSEIPAPVFQLESLKSLRVNDNQLKSISNEITNLTNLEELWLTYNQIGEIPPAIFQMTQLKKLYLGYNEISELPDEVANLTQLQVLDLEDNHIQTLPASFTQLSSLKEILITRNPLIYPPREVAEQGIEAVRDYFTKQSQTSKKDSGIYTLQGVQEALQDNNISKAIDFLEEHAYQSGKKSSQVESEASNFRRRLINHQQRLEQGVIDQTTFEQKMKVLTQDIQEVIGRFGGASHPNNSSKLSYDSVKQRIKEASERDNVYLDLGNLGLREIPDEVFDLIELESLLLGGVNSLAYPDRNQISELPPEISRLQNLKHLEISYANLKTIPDEIGQLRNLESLILRSNQITFLPESLGNLSRLTLLNVRGNHLKHLPNSIGSLNSLKELKIYDNLIEYLSDTIANLNKLETIAAQRNRLKELPLKFGELSSLRRLYLSENQITQLPPSFAYLTKLRALELDLNPLSEPPISVVEQGIEAIKAYFRNSNSKLKLDYPKITKYLFDSVKGQYKDLEHGHIEDIIKEVLAKSVEQCSELHRAENYFFLVTLLKYATEQEARNISGEGISPSPDTFDQRGVEISITMRLLSAYLLGKSESYFYQKFLEKLQSFNQDYPKYVYVFNKYCELESIDGLSHAEIVSEIQEEYTKQFGSELSVDRYRKLKARAIRSLNKFFSNLSEMDAIKTQLKFTKSEISILSLIVKGLNTSEIASRLHIAMTTVYTHRRNLMDKIGVKDIKGLIKFARENGFT